MPAGHLASYSPGVKKFFARNIDRRGRLLRAVGGVLFVAGGGLVCGCIAWLAMVLILVGGFMLFEAARGWCLARACGIKTKL